jgi:adenine-specific DNA-methyltransferase
MSDVEKLNGQSKDFQEDKLEMLKENFPEVFTEDGIVDCDKLKQTLDEDHIASDIERYGLSWAGKHNCFKEIQQTTTKTLKPQPDESVDFEDSENIFIEGENLETLKVLQKAYHNKVKMIYIDPPYNTGKDFVYRDKWQMEKEEFEKESGERNGDGEKIRAFKQNTKGGRYHSNWLNMMYPRLFLARNLLREDGAIFVSIDDNEVHNLRHVMDEIFGEENFVAQLTVVNNLKGNQDQFGFAGTHEYCLVYARSKEKTELGKLSLQEWERDRWQQDEIGFYKKGANLKATGKNAPREKRPNLFFPIYITADNELFLERQSESNVKVLPISKGEEMSWRWSKKRFREEKHNVIVVRSGQNISLYKKQRPQIGDIPSKKPKTTFYKPEYSSGKGTQEIKQLFNNKRVFLYPKPVVFVQDLVELGIVKEGIILDFFAGSAATAHAVMKQNAEDGGGRKYVMVQLPEETDEDSEAKKAGYENIAEIAKERIRRAAKKMKEDYDDTSELDLGFKAFKLAETNFKQWVGENIKNEEQLKEQLKMFVDNLKEGAEEKDLLFELMSKRGIDPNAKVEEKDGFYLVNNTHAFCLSQEITEELVDSIIETDPEVVICLDVGFSGNDELKTNMALRLKDKEIEFKVV